SLRRRSSPKRRADRRQRKRRDRVPGARPLQPPTALRDSSASANRKRRRPHCHTIGRSAIRREYPPSRSDSGSRGGMRSQGREQGAGEEAGSGEQEAGSGLGVVAIPKLRSHALRSLSLFLLLAPCSLLLLLATCFF